MQAELKLLFHKENQILERYQISMVIIYEFELFWYFGKIMHSFIIAQVMEIVCILLF